MRFTSFTGPKSPTKHGKNAKVAKSTRVCPPTGPPWAFQTVWAAEVCAHCSGWELFQLVLFYFGHFGLSLWRRRRRRNVGTIAQCTRRDALLNISRQILPLIYTVDGQMSLSLEVAFPSPPHEMKGLLALELAWRKHLHVLAPIVVCLRLIYYSLLLLFSSALFPLHAGRVVWPIALAPIFLWSFSRRMAMNSVTWITSPLAFVERKGLSKGTLIREEKSMVMKFHGNVQVEVRVNFLALFASKTHIFMCGALEQSGTVRANVRLNIAIPMFFCP